MRRLPRTFVSTILGKQRLDLFPARAVRPDHAAQNLVRAPRQVVALAHAPQICDEFCDASDGGGVCGGEMRGAGEADEEY
jgi:hypothetical protein